MWIKDEESRVKVLKMSSTDGTIHELCVVLTPFLVAFVLDLREEEAIS
jgi:hypothetical protein